MGPIRDILYVRFSLPELGPQAEFLSDFGLVVDQSDNVLYARGTDDSRYIYVAEPGIQAFRGMGFEATSEEALRAVAEIDNVSVEENPRPGGGLIAQLTDPDGYTVDLVYGIEPLQELAPPQRSALNTGTQRNRLGERALLSESTVGVKRLGHCVLNVTDFRASEAWYKERLQFITSDEVYLGEESNTLGAFLRCNRDDHYVDHHTLFLVNAGSPSFNHAAFEVADWDTLMLGHDLLKERDYEHRWGVGKHVLGSQVFDYWKDLNGFTLEHFTDGDLMNSAFGSHKAPVEQLMATHWGPEGNP